MICLQKRCDKSLVWSFVNLSLQDDFKITLNIWNFISYSLSCESTLEAINEFEKNIGRSLRALQIANQLHCRKENY